MQDSVFLSCSALPRYRLCCIETICRPAGTHLQVRCEAVHCLGLYCLLDHIETDLGKHLKALRAAVLAWSPAGGAPAEVALAAVQVRGHVLLAFGDTAG